MTITPVTGDDYLDRARAAGVDLPLEQTPVWDRFDEAMAGRKPFGQAVFTSGGEDRAFISLAEMEGHGFTYLWAKHGPVWASAPSAAEEARFRSELRKLVPSKVAFVRLHAEHRSDELSDLLQSVTYDRTIVLDLTLSEDDLMASFKKRGRRDVRKAGRNESLAFADETERAGEAFSDAYALLEETGERDAFGIAPESIYRTMLESLEGHVRFYTVRLDGDLACWGIVTTFDNQATYYYAASSAAGRKAGAPDLLVWEMSKDLRGRGITHFDLMGIDSDRAPQLSGVTGFKTKFSEEITDVAGAWDLPTRPLLYRGLHAARKAQVAAKAKLRAGKEKLRNRSGE